MATYDLTQSTPDSINVGDIINCPYSGSAKSITLSPGVYQLEVWGAQGGYRSSATYGGKGGYSIGTITLQNNTTVYCYAGGSGNTGGTSGGFNGGGTRNSYNGGGGGSDIRIGSDSLYARVIVAGGGGSDGATSKQGMYGGGTSGGTTTQSYGSGGGGGTQTAGGTGSSSANGSGTSGTYGAFGIGGRGYAANSGYAGAGGGGWYGGAGSYPDGSGDDDRGGGGGSGYIYTSSTASNYPSGCLLTEKYYLTDAETIAGNAAFLSPEGTSETGHSGNGYIRITFIQSISTKIKVKINGEIKDITKLYIKISNLWICGSMYYKNTVQVVNKPYDERIEYIDSTGTQWIDTGIIPTNNTKVQFKFINKEVTGDVILGYNENSDLKDWRFFNYSSHAYFDAISGRIYGGTINANTLYELELGNYYVKNLTTGANIISETAASVYTGIDSIKLNRDTYNNRSSKNKWYYVKIFEGNTLIRDFVPVKKDNKGYLYDKVENKLYANKGTGNFTLGSVITDDIDPTNFIETRTWHKI